MERLLEVIRRLLVIIVWLPTVGMVAYAVFNYEPKHANQIDEAVLAQCIYAYQQMGCWPVEMAISDSGYNAMLDIFEFDGKISQRHPYESICMRA